MALNGATAASLTLPNVQLSDTGSYALAVSNSVSSNSTSNSAVLSVTWSFASWQQGKFTAAERLNPNVSGPNAVFGLDGLPNLVKYALGLEPKQNITAGLPDVTVVGPEWVFTYTRPSTTSDVIYAVEVSTDLTTWGTAGVIHELVSTAGGVETWRGRYPVGAGPNAFLRLNVTQP